MFFAQPLGPWGRSKCQILFNFSYKVNFKDFVYQSLCVFSQIFYERMAIYIFKKNSANTQLSQAIPIAIMNEKS